MLTSPHLDAVNARSVATLIPGNLTTTTGDKCSCVRNTRTSTGNALQPVWFA